MSSFQTELESLSHRGELDSSRSNASSISSTRFINIGVNSSIYRQQNDDRNALPSPTQTNYESKDWPFGESLLLQRIRDRSSSAVSMDGGNESPSRSHDRKKEKRSTKSKCPPGLRSGKWTAEEEAFTNKMIHYFKLGLLDIEDGTSLRYIFLKCVK
jgi:hypothetical protein